jgi:hyperosmotically inducible protein
MKPIALLIPVLLALPAYAQDKTSEQATEEGRSQNTQFAKDATLTTKVHTALANDVGMKTLTKINVDSSNGVVTLKGEVDSAETSKRAEAVAKKVGGVSSVRNELKVRG